MSSFMFIQQQWTISWLDCDMWRKVDFIQWLATTSSVAGLRRSYRAIPNTKLALKKGHSHCLVVCCLSDPPQLPESRWNHCIWEVCSANWWDAPKTAMPAAGIGQQKGPNSSLWQCPIDHTLHNPHFKSWTNWAMRFCLIHHIHLTSHQSRASWVYNFFKHLDNNFLQGKRFHNEQEAENAFQEFIKSGSVDFYTTGTNLFSLANM